MLNDTHLPTDWVAHNRYSFIYKYFSYGYATVQTECRKKNSSSSCLSVEHSLLFFSQKNKTRSSRLTSICDGCCCCHHFLARRNNQLLLLLFPSVHKFGFIFVGHHTPNLRPHLEAIDAPPLKFIDSILIHESIKRRICLCARSIYQTAMNNNKNSLHFHRYLISSSSTVWHFSFSYGWLFFDTFSQHSVVVTI